MKPITEIITCSLQSSPVVNNSCSSSFTFIPYPITKSSQTLYYSLQSLSILDCSHNSILNNLLENHQINIKLFIKLLLDHEQAKHHGDDHYLVYHLNGMQFEIQQYFTSSIELILEINQMNGFDYNISQMIMNHCKDIKLYCSALSYMVSNRISSLSTERSSWSTDMSRYSLQPSSPSSSLDHIMDTTPSPTINIDKYMKQRHKLFSKFDEGIQLDTTSWYEVTPETIAKYIAEKINSIGHETHSTTGHSTTAHSHSPNLHSRHKIIVIDAFTGCGGNMIQFLLQPNIDLVIGCDISDTKLEYCRHNITVYGCNESKMKLVHGDYMEHLKRGTFLKMIQDYVNDHFSMQENINDHFSMQEHSTMKRENELKNSNMIIIAFLAPPYGTMNYLSTIYNLKTDLLINNNTHNGIDIYRYTRDYLTRNIIYLLPKNVNIKQVSYQIERSCNSCGSGGSSTIQQVSESFDQIEKRTTSSSEEDSSDQTKESTYLDFEYIYMDDVYLKLIFMYTSELMEHVNPSSQ